MAGSLGPEQPGNAPRAASRASGGDAVLCDHPVVMTDPDLVSVEVAGQLSGVTSRTLRRWIASGQLPAVSGKRGKLVRLGDIARVVDDLGHDVGHAIVPPDTTGGQSAGHAGHVSESPPIATSARSQLEAIRDEWLRPLIEELNAKSERIGHLTAERDAAIKAADGLREEKAFLRAIQAERAQQPTPETGEVSDPSQTENVALEPVREAPRGSETHRESEDAAIGPPAWRRADEGHELGPDQHRESIVAAVWRRLFRS